MLDAESRQDAMLSGNEEDDLDRVSPNELIKHVTNLSINEVLTNKQLANKNQDIMGTNEYADLAALGQAPLQMKPGNIDTQTQTVKSQLEHSNSIDSSEMVL